MNMEEITATYRHEVHRWDDTIIAECVLPSVNGEPPQHFSAKIPDCPIGTLAPHLAYRLYGHWTTYANKRTSKTEKQFAAKTFVQCQPHGQSGVVAYLQRAPKIGRVIAVALWRKFQGQAVEILRGQPDVAAAAVPKLTPENAKLAAAWLESEKALEDTTIELIDLLGGRGFPRNLGKRLVMGTASNPALGSKAAEVVQADPYVLLDYRGCGFGLTDKMHLDLGGDPNSLRRQSLCVWDACKRDNDGNTWLSQHAVVTALSGKVSGAAVRAPDAVMLAKEAGLVAIRRDEGGRLWFAEKGRAEDEARVAEGVRQALGEEADWPENCDKFDGLSSHQALKLFCYSLMQDLVLPLRSPLAILGGGPGTGKTFVLATVVKALVDLHGSRQVAVATPTGKAAVRVNEVLSDFGVSIRATTIHRLLKATYADGAFYFGHDEDEPLPYRYVVIDEDSMKGTGLAARVFAARAKGAHFIFVGDINQLPPVEHGRPLADMIAAGVPYGELTELHRQAAGSSIALACKAIREGKPFKTDQRLDPDNGKNLMLIPGPGAAGLEKIVSTLKSLPADIDPVWDCQVVVAVNDKSPLSRKAVNQRLQAELNPIGQAVEGSPFRTNDKIICLKNGSVPADKNAGDPDVNQGMDEDGKVYVANGEMGMVLKVEPKRILAAFTNPDRQIVIPVGKQDDGESSTGNFDLAYGATCHKLQGSEYKVVIVVLDDYPGARMVCSREWLHTALSRAKVVCVLVGNRATADAMCNRLSLGKRKTFLKELICG